MSSILTYRPRPLALPPSAPITRRFVDHRSHLRGAPRLGADDLARYEGHTIFHDVFLAGDELRALGPPLGNLARVVLPLRCRLLQAGRPTSPPLPHRIVRHERCAMHRFRLPPALRDANAVRVSVELATGQRAELDAVRQTLAPVFLQFTTLQKDNPVTWIADWLHHAAGLGVERVLLYDNASAGADELSARLDALRDIPPVVLVHWPYAYGPSRSHYNQFAQASQNNHAHACFGAATWCGHFDVDEYPVSDDGRPLVDHLEGLSPRTGLLRLDSWWAPRVTDAAAATAAAAAVDGDGDGDGTAGRGETAEGNGGGDGDANGKPLPTVRDFPYRERQARGKARKYVVRGRALKSARVHNARLRLGWWRRNAPPEQLGFVHYRALNSGWKGDRGQAVPLDPSRHVAEPRVLKGLPRLGATSER